MHFSRQGTAEQEVVHLATTGCTDPTVDIPEPLLRCLLWDVFILFSKKRIKYTINSLCAARHTKKDFYCSYTSEISMQTSSWKGKNSGLVLYLGVFVHSCISPINTAALTKPRTFWNEQFVSTLISASFQGFKIHQWLLLLSPFLVADPWWVGPVCSPDIGLHIYPFTWAGFWQFA